jgi:hypothetical protein
MIKYQLTRVSAAARQSFMPIVYPLDGVKIHEHIAEIADLALWKRPSPVPFAPLCDRVCCDYRRGNDPLLHQERKSFRAFSDFAIAPTLIWLVAEWRPYLGGPKRDTEGNVCGWVNSLSPFLVANSIENEVKGLFAAGEIKNHGLENALLIKLDSAANARSRSSCDAARNIFQAFINLTQAQSGNGIVKSAALNLITDAQYLISHCSGT